ncbi:DUF1995 family protein [Cyanobacteria bacterium FACHB-471]|nr:DUF1995 family protein [Cyanobacteria bacterium FACHB-471]
MSELPNTLDDAIAQAQQATQAAIAAGRTRLQVELAFPELKILPVAEKFIPAFEDLGSQLRVFFPDAGSAALARRDWGEKPYSIRAMGEIKAEIQPEDKLFVFVEPSAVEIAQVEKLCETALDRPVVLLNPRLEDIATIGIGYAGRQLRDRLLSTFESCYYLKPLEGAALLRSFPDPWQVWIEKDTGYQLIAEEPQKPVGEALDEIFARGTGQPTAQQTSRKGLLSGLQQFLRALSQ